MTGRRIFVGLSGGVDSAVTAALCKESGAEVTGVFIKGWYPPGLPCTWNEDRRDAMRVAARLGIPFLTLDASSEYKKSVIDYLVSEYAAGRTPNPDIMCNRDVKFGAFYRFAREHGADFIATGHYAQIKSSEDAKNAAAERVVPEKPAAAGKLPVEQHFLRLTRGIDASKDQSYFLWAIPKEALPHVLFPLGGMHKDAVRRLAKKFDLPVAEKRDSQGICFLGDVSIESFLRSEVGLSQGMALDTEGKSVGTHEGVIAYTLGERVSLTDAEPGPWYVIKKDIANNTLTVSHTPAAGNAESPTFTLSETSWLAEWDTEKTYKAQYRYHGPIIEGKLASDGSRFTPTKPLPELIAAGQSLVIYEGDRLIGGGIIGA